MARFKPYNRLSVFSPGSTRNELSRLEASAEDVCELTSKCLVDFFYKVEEENAGVLWGNTGTTIPQEWDDELETELPYDNGKEE
jgi:hypothetical protein